MRDLINNIVSDEIVKASLAKIDIESLAKEMAPKIRAEIKKGILACIKNMDWESLLSERTRVYDLIADHAAAVLRDGFKLDKPKRKRR